MKVRIVNDGERSYMTKITNAETGEQLDLNITELTINAREDVPRAILTSALPVVDVIADAEVRHVCPCCGRPPEPEPTSRLQKMLIDTVKAWGAGKETNSNG